MFKYSYQEFTGSEEKQGIFAPLEISAAIFFGLMINRYFTGRVDASP
jgi:hypothetical protein